MIFVIFIEKLNIIKNFVLNIFFFINIMMKKSGEHILNVAKNTLDVVKDIVNTDKVTLVEYVWIGGNNELRGKTKVVNKSLF